MVHNAVQFANVLKRLTALRNTLSSDEQVVLDSVVCTARPGGEDEVVAHSLSQDQAVASQGDKQVQFAAQPLVTFNTATGEYQVVFQTTMDEDKATFI